MRRLAIALALLPLALVACTRDVPPVEADPTSLRILAQGSLVGSTLEGAHAWRGIPFARPPLGELRWRPPQPPERWPGVREALAFGPICPQFDRSWKPGGDEDCLVLNVYAPRFAPDRVPRGAERLPVMVYIHGGGQSIGSSHFAVGSRLAAENRVVVVTVQYRLGVLGWFSHPALQADAMTPDERSGNWGTLDLIRSLEWVRDNVSAFGGDPGNVTIFGQSAGGINVFAMLLSPRTKGLFHRAISQSGFSTTFSRAQAEHYADAPEPGDEASSRELVLMLLERDGRAADRAAAKVLAREMSDAETAAYLRSKTARELIEPFRGAPGSIGGIYVAPFSIRDGSVLPAEPAETLLARGRYHRVPIVLGTNRDENKAYLLVTSPYVSRLGQVPLRVSDWRRYEQVAEYGALLWKALGADEPASAIRRHQGAVWVYRWDWDQEAGPPWIDFSQLLGAAHGTELPFVFGSPEEAGEAGLRAARRSRAKLTRSCAELDVEAAVHRDDGAVLEGRRGQHQAQRDLRHLLRVAVAAQRHAPAREDGLLLVGDRGGHARLDGPGADGVHRDALASELHGEPAREPHHPVLAGGVGAVEARGAQALGRGDVHDAAGVGLAQVGERRADQVHLRLEVHRQGAAPDVEVALVVEGSEAGVARVVDQDVELNPVRREVGDEGLQGLAVRDVERAVPDGAAGGADLLGHGLELALVEVDDADASSLVGEKMRSGASHPARRPGDQGDAAFDGAAESGETRHVGVLRPRLYTARSSRVIVGSEREPRRGRSDYSATPLAGSRAMRWSMRDAA